MSIGARQLSCAVAAYLEREISEVMVAQGLGSRPDCEFNQTEDLATSWMQGDLRRRKGVLDDEGGDKVGSRRFVVDVQRRSGI